MPIQDKIMVDISDVVQWRQWLHQYPEMAFKEVRTAGFVADKLASFGMEVNRGLATTGVVGTLKAGDASCGAIGLRADMDALAIREDNDLSYRSRNDGVMHACGHDGHTAMLLGAARHLARERNFDGTVHFIFQPAEEKEGGARVMIEQGLFDQYPVDEVYGMHNFPMLPPGTFAIRKGPMMAASDGFSIRVKGSGGHTAMPHLAGDVIVGASAIVTQLQSIVSRNIDPAETAVISVTDFHSGSHTNVLPDAALIRGYNRLFSPAVQTRVEQRIRQIAKGVSKAMGLECEIDYFKRYPVLVNTGPQTDMAISAARMTVGKDKVFTDIPPVMGSEDFAFMLQEKPGAFIGIGYGTPESGGMLHQSRYDFNDELLAVGIQYLARLIETRLPRRS